MDVPSQVNGPAYEFDGTYPGTCVRLQPLNLWWASLILLVLGMPSYRLLWSMLSSLLDPAASPLGRAFQGFGLLFYLVWHLAFLLPALYLWIGRLEFRVNVERRRVEIHRGVGRFGWTWAWDFKDVVSLQRMKWERPKVEGAPAPPVALPSSGFILNTKRRPMLWGFSVKGEDAERLLETLKHRHPMFHPAEHDPLHS